MKRAMKRTMKRTIIVPLIALVAIALSAQADAKTRHARPRATAAQASGTVTYNRDARDPNVGWHWEGGMRTCHQDCDNPEIPGSGYTCKNVNAMGMAMRECDWSSD